MQARLGCACANSTACPLLQILSPALDSEPGTDRSPQSRPSLLCASKKVFELLSRSKLSCRGAHALMHWICLRPGPSRDNVSCVGAIAMHVSFAGVSAAPATLIGGDDILHVYLQVDHHPLYLKRIHRETNVCFIVRTRAGQKTPHAATRWMCVRGGITRERDAPRSRYRGWRPVSPACLAGPRHSFQAPAPPPQPAAASSPFLHVIGRIGLQGAGGNAQLLANL